MSTKPRDQPPSPDRETRRGLSVTLREVSKTYRAGSGALTAVERIDAAITPGEFVSIVGPSGCGKSTVIKMIAGLIPPSGGRVEVDGRAVQSPTTEAGVVFQQDLLLEWRNVLRNVLLQAEIRGQSVRRYEQRARDLLHSVGLGGFVEYMPHELSGGMRQRVAICRALLHDPPLLLMDEPFGAVDAITRDQLNVDLRTLCDQLGCTVVFVTHSISEAVFLSDRVLVMGPQPARIADTVEVKLPPGRALSTREDAAFAGYVGRIRAAFERMGVLRDREADGDSGWAGAAQQRTATIEGDESRWRFRRTSR